MRALVIKNGKVENVIVIEQKDVDSFKQWSGADAIINEEMVASVQGEKPTIDWKHDRGVFTKPERAPAPVQLDDGSYIDPNGFVCTPPPQPPKVVKQKK